jgi:hypothetical protein
MLCGPGWVSWMVAAVESTAVRRVLALRKEHSLGKELARAA